MWLVLSSFELSCVFCSVVAWVLLGTSPVVSFRLTRTGRNAEVASKQRAAAVAAKLREEKAREQQKFQNDMAAADKKEKEILRPAYKAAQAVKDKAKVGTSVNATDHVFGVEVHDRMPLLPTPPLCKILCACC